MVWTRSPTLSLICKNGSVLEIQSFGPYTYYQHSRTKIHYHFRGTLIITLTYLRFSIVNKRTWQCVILPYISQPLRIFEVMGTSPHYTTGETQSSYRFHQVIIYINFNTRYPKNLDKNFVPLTATKSFYIFGNPLRSLQFTSRSRFEQKYAT